MFLICRLKKIKFLIDFHNYGFTILNLSMKNKLVIKLVKWYEKFFGSKADFAFCVSDKMKADL